jgi:hypothetical protein
MSRLTVVIEPAQTAKRAQDLPLCDLGGSVQNEDVSRRGIRANVIDPGKREELCFDPTRVVGGAAHPGNLDSHAAVE